MKSSKILIVMSSLVLSTLFVGCGGTDAAKIETVPPTGQPAPQPAPAVPPSTTLSVCPSGSKRIGNSDCMPIAYFSPFSTACSLSGGTPYSGGTLCKQEITTNTYAMVSQISRLPYSQPQHATAFKPLYFAPSGARPWVVFNTDRIQLTQITSGSGWGGVESSQTTFLGIPIQSWSYNCDATSVTGVANGSQLTNDGFNAGFVVGNGSQVMQFDTVNVPRTFTSMGDLRVGFNVPDGTGQCQDMGFKMKVTHCEDANGNSVSCP